MVSNLSQREPPQNLEAERSVLGSVLLDYGGEALEDARTLTPEDFYGEANRLAYRAMIRLGDRGSAIDLTTLTEELRQSRDLEAVGGPPYLVGLMEGTPTSAHIAHYVEIVLETSRRRRLEIALRRLLSEVHRGERSAEELLGSALKELRHLAPADQRWPVRASDLVPPLPEPLLSAHSQGGALLGPGEVLLLTGAGEAGKSTLLRDLALQIAAIDDGDSRGLPHRVFFGRGAPVLFVTFEDSADRTRHLLQQAAEYHKAHEWDLSAALERIHVLGLRGRPLYGPPEVPGRATRQEDHPRPLAGWWDLWRGVDETEAGVIAIDPALAAFTGQSNAAGPVRAFLAALAEEAAARKAGVILVAHSTKGARAKEADPYDPGQVGGSAHWTDGVRGAIGLEWRRTDETHDPPTLRILKANYGPSRIRCELEPIRNEKGVPVGFKAKGGWTGPGAKGSEQHGEEVGQKNPYA